MEKARGETKNVEPWEKICWARAQERKNSDKSKFFLHSSFLGTRWLIEKNNKLLMKHSQLSFSCSTERMEFPKARAQLQRIFHDHTGKVWIIAFSRDVKSHEISPALRSSIKIIVLILGRRISNDFLTRVLIVIIYLVKRRKKLWTQR